MSVESRVPPRQRATRHGGRGCYGASGIAVSAERPIADARIAVAANFRDTAEAIALHLEAHSELSLRHHCGLNG